MHDSFAPPNSSPHFYSVDAAYDSERSGDGANEECANAKGGACSKNGGGAIEGED
jgi:hypothetical protein